MLVFTLLFTLLFVSACGVFQNNNNESANNEANAEEEQDNEVNRNEDEQEAIEEENEDNLSNEENEEENNPSVENNELNNNNDEQSLNNNNNNDDNNNNNNNNDENGNDETAKDLAELDTKMDVEESKFADLIEYMEDETEGEARVLFETEESQEHDMEDVSLTLEGYTIVALEDFHKNFSIPFDDETDGAVIITEYTMKNDSDDDVFFMPSFNMTYNGAEKAFNNDPNLLPLDEQLIDKQSVDNHDELKAGEEVSGYYTYPFGGDALADAMEEGETEVEIAQPQEDEDDYKTALGEESQFSINLNQESSDETESSASEDFYEDKITIKNWGEKEMLDEEENIGKTEELRDVDITLEGYQFTAFEPGEELKNAFESFDEGAVLVTVKFDVDNGGEDEIGKSMIDSDFIMNNGKQYTVNETTLLNYKMNDTIEPGDEDELLQIYAIDQEQYEKIWKDKPFEIELGPMRDKEAEDISKGHTVEFDLK